MSHGGGKGTPGMSELGFIIVFIIVLWIVWFFTGGSQKQGVDDKPFMTAPDPIKGGTEVYGPADPTPAPIPTE
jgi:xanthine/uracil permease